MRIVLAQRLISLTNTPRTRRDVMDFNRRSRSISIVAAVRCHAIETTLALRENVYSGTMSSQKGGLPLRRTVDEVVNAHLEDLQAEMEAGARKLDVVAERAAEIREAILNRHLRQAAVVGALVRRVTDLQQSVRQQQERLADLRRAIQRQRERELRDL